MPLTAGLIVAGVSGLVKTGIGLYQHAKAAKDLKNAVQPLYNIPKEWYDNDNIAGNQAQTGLSAPSMNYYTTQAGRGLSSGLGTILQGGGSVNNIAALYDSYDTGINKIAAEDSQLKNENIKSFMDANANLANEKDKQWTLNEYQPYENRVKADNQKMNAGTQTMFNGMSDIGNGLAAYSKATGYTDTDPKQTMGEKYGIDAIDPGSTPAPAISTNPVFSTPGGSAVLSQTLQSNPNSPYVQQLLKSMNNGMNYMYN